MKRAPVLRERSASSKTGSEMPVACHVSERKVPPRVLRSERKVPPVSAREQRERLRRQVPLGYAERAYGEQIAASGLRPPRNDGEKRLLRK